MEQETSNAGAQEVLDGSFQYDNPSADTVQPEPSITQAPLEIAEEVQTEQGSEVAGQQEESAKDDPNRMAYWQSQADKAKNDAQAMAKELNLYKRAVDAMQNNAPVSNRTQPRPQDDLLKEPLPPEKPVSYNEVDAYNDPESDSFNFRMSKEKYQDQRYEYLKRLEHARQIVQDRKMAEQQNDAMIGQAYVQAKNAYGWNDGKTTEFIRWAQDPSNVTLDVLAKLFEIQNAPSPERVASQQRVQDFTQQAQAVKVPTTAVAQPGVQTPPVSDEDMFNASLLSHSTVRK
tara:strand:+ start:3101 stop:3964 length:864 start_codon:yes stop_codon:yes gene_type:complete